MTSPLSQAAIRIRIREWLAKDDVSMVDVAEKTGDSYQRVQRWLGSDVKIPADFLARLVVAVPISSRWMLTGEGEPNRLEPGEAERFRSAVRNLLEG